MPDPVPDDEELFALMHRAVRQVRREVSGELEPLGITPGQHRLLRVLTQEDEPLRLSTVAERLGIAPRSVTTVVDEAEAGGLVRRRPDPADRRAVLVALTDRGREVLDRAATARRQQAARLLGALDDAQRRDLAALLRPLVGPEAVAGEQQAHLTDRHPGGRRRAR